jgi:hypothetical protein
VAITSKKTCVLGVGEFDLQRAGFRYAYDFEKPLDGPVGISERD